MGTVFVNRWWKEEIRERMMQLQYIFLLSTIFPFCISFYSPEASIATIMKATLVNMTTYQVSIMMKHHFQQLQLYSENDTWSHPRLQAIGSYLLPSNLTRSDLARLVDEMARNAERNKYLHNFLAQAKGSDFADVALKISKQGATLLPDVAAYAMVLNRLVGAMKNDVKILVACREVWRDRSNLGNILSRRLRHKRSILPAFVVAKTVSINHAVDTAIEAFEEGDVDPDFASKQLPVNIIEAKTVDVSRGNLYNAKVALILASQTPGGKLNNCTGSGPSHFSADGKAIEIHLPFPVHWADLYETWNLAFVSILNRWPYTFAKLLIPNVSDYHSHPSRFLYNRVLGLYTHINWSLMGNIYGGKTPGQDMNWHSPSLTRSWGRANYESAKHYEALLATCP